MCCFSRPVDFVRDTSIFARPVEGGKQLVAYGMSLRSREELAMILPIPVPVGTADGAVRFMDLSAYEDLFADLWKGFDHPQARSIGITCASPGKGLARLEVIKVGSFDASFVPTTADFARLDPRFRLPDGFWEKLSTYRDHGFVVFKLRAGQQRVHPMAFTFPTRRPREIFFPTVHIHDGRIHDLAQFDHHLFAQTDGRWGRRMIGWRESRQPARLFLKLDQCDGLFLPEEHCHYRRLAGRLKNQDTWVRFT